MDSVKIFCPLRSHFIRRLLAKKMKRNTAYFAQIHVIVGFMEKKRHYWVGVGGNMLLPGEKFLP